MSNWESALIHRAEGLVEGFVGHEANVAADAVVGDVVSHATGETATQATPQTDSVVELAQLVLAELKKVEGSIVDEAKADVAKIIGELHPALAAVTTDAAITADNGGQA